MKHILESLKKHRRSFWFSMLINAVFLVLLMLVTKPVYESNDDAAMVSMFNNARGGVDAYSNASSYLYGLFLIFLYRITSSVPWHCVVLYLTVFFSLSAITHVILNRFRGWAGMALSSVIMVFFGYQCYTVINFTRAAACGTAAGAFLILSAMAEKKVRKNWILWGSLLVFIGYNIRPNEGLAVGLCMTSGGVYLLLMLIRAEKRTRLKRLLKYAAGMIPVVALVAASAGIEKYEISSDPERLAYREYAHVRTRLMDHGFPGYPENYKTYQELDINENAYKLYRNWDFYDTEKMSTDVMKQIQKLQPEEKITAATVKSYFNTYPERYFRNMMFLLFLFVLLLLAVYGRHNLSVLLTVIYQILLMAGVILYLFADKRSGLVRVEMGLWLGATLILVIMLDEKNFAIDRRSSLVLMLTALIFGQMDWSDQYRRLSTKGTAKKEKARELVAPLTADKEHLYICNTGDYLPVSAYGPFEPIPEYYVSNIVPLGSWICGSVPYTHALEAYGVENPYRDMIGNDKVRLVAIAIKPILQYLQDYYDADCTAEEVGTMGDAKIYVIHE